MYVPTDLGDQNWSLSWIQSYDRELQCQNCTIFQRNATSSLVRFKTKKTSTFLKKTI
jgi:hypothetical protein